ncbi:MAG: DUF3160 domain-containing protein [Chloroflexi bacterium]|nr:DUF3160 domain-containing protein [Chloroflexota bacterium]
MHPKSLLRIGLLVLLLVLVACGGKEAAPTAVPESPTAVSEIAPTPPPVTPTIVIPAATDTAVPPTDEPPPTAVPVPEVAASDMPRFAQFKETAVTAAPAIFHDLIAPDLSNVLVPFALSPDQLARLAQSGVVVSPGVEKEFFSVYEQARYANVPIFVTSDSLLHSYHLIFDKVLRTAEREFFAPLLRDLNAAILAETDAQYQELKGSEWEDAALRSVAFVGAASKLLEPTVQIPVYAQELAEAEIALIEDAGGILPSPLFPGLEFGEDYTQYIPRGHYTLSEELMAYFKSMMWYGRMTFRLKSNDLAVGRAETRSALLLVNALQNATVNGRPALDVWRDVYDPTAFLVGRSDDLTAFQYIDVMTAVYGDNPNLTTLSDENRLTAFIEAANLLPPPRILGLVISETDDVEEVTKGFRFMGQRFVPDAYIFRELIWRNVGTTDEPRQLPNGLDVMAAMGSDRAYTILESLGETNYVGYPAQMDKMRAWTGSLTADEWTETLYNGWLFTLQPLLDAPTTGYPQFMLSDAWLDKQLSTSLGSWAELKHDTILYAKQAYAELGGGGLNPPSPKEAVGYVEPVPAFYARLSALATMTLDGMDERGLLTEKDADSLNRLIRLADAFQMMAEKELRGEPLSQDEAYLIRYVGGELEHLVMASADVPEDDPFAQPYMDEEPQAAVIADVATAPDYVRDGVPDPTVLEVGVGRVDELYAVVPFVAEDGTITLQVAKGGVFSYYEFPWPAADRLTDEKWREMLDAGEGVARPSWITTFFSAETEFAFAQQAIYAFQTNLPWLFWEPAEYMEGRPWLPAPLPAFQAELDALIAAGQYVGRQWISASYRSFDLQGPDTAVVTVRETWGDTLYEAPNGYPDYDDPVLGHRGPYTLDATYTLQRVDGVWQVTNLVYANQPPNWQTP